MRAMSQAVENTPFWLKDNFAVFEETTAENLSVRGTIPARFERTSLEKWGQSADWRVAPGSRQRDVAWRRVATDQLTGIATVT